MIEFGRLYKENSNPLEEIQDKKIGEIYYTVEGHGVKYVKEDEFEFMYRTPLVDSELMTDLSPKLLKVFWAIHKNQRDLKPIH